MMEKLLLDLSINVTAMFRDPRFYVAFRKHVVPMLRTYPFIRIWHAGCSTGEEVYSMAMLLREEGLYDRSRIYATDINEVVLKRAKAGIFPLERMQEYTDNYCALEAKIILRVLHGQIRRSAVRSVADEERGILAAQPGNRPLLSECNVILCRNVLIYFDKTLQSKVHSLFYDSLAMSECLCSAARRRPDSWRTRNAMSR